MRKVLVVTPRFPPVNAADHHRVRMALAYLADFGWSAEVLCVDPCYIPNERDENLSKTYPDDLPIHKVAALSANLTRFCGLGSLAIRSYNQLRLSGNRLLKQGQFDLVFISTTEFPVFSLGVGWKKKFKVPFIVDFQDPWLSDYYDQLGAPPPPGGRLKYTFNQWLAQWLEPRVMRSVEKSVCVSPAYPEMLIKRYAWLEKDHFSILPFGAAENDFTSLPSINVTQRFFSDDGKIHWVYVGRGGLDMSFSLRCFFTALQKARQSEPARWSNLVIYFIGTDYAPGDRARKTVEPVAQECGVGDLVHEFPHRIPYFEAIQCLMDADGLIVPGSDDSGYTASKLYPYIFARKPLLTIFHKDSSVVEVMRTTKAGVCATFANTEETDLNTCVDEIRQKWFDSGCDQIPDTDWFAVKPYTAREMTRRLCAVFDSALDSSKGRHL